MNKSWSLFLIICLGLLQTSRAQDAFRISIVKGDQEPKLNKKQIEQLSKSGDSSLDQLPIVVCPADKGTKIKADPSNTFQIVIENTQANGTKITMLASNWYNCLTFKLVDNAGAIYSISRTPMKWTINGRETITWPAHGKKTWAVFFFGLQPGGLREWYAWKGSDQDDPVWPVPKHPVIAHLTATFGYYDETHHFIAVSSKPTDVILMAE